tara:strand:+ start:513 stop:803 length:291 start_codon:yes stop_codon:yes gene_type:complete
LLSSILFYIYHLNSSDNKFYNFRYSYNGIKLLPENAPPLKSLFNPNDLRDPHNTFTSVESCLKCHIQGVEINNERKAPQIAHNIQDYCVSCHALAK